MSVPGIVAVSCLLLRNDVVRDVPFHTTTALLAKLLPSTVRTKPLPPAVALLGESELTDGVDGQEQETAGSRKIANAPKRKRGDFFIVAIGVHFRQIIGRAEYQGIPFQRITPRISSCDSSAASTRLSYPPWPPATGDGAAPMIPSYLVPWNPTSRNRCEEVGHLADPFYCVTVTVIAFEVIVLLPLT